jgi:putative endopeptidase
MKPLVPAVSDTSVPGDGFYTFVNETWLKGHHVKSWQPEYGVSDEMTDKTNKELLTILHSLSFLKPHHLKPKSPKEHLQVLGYIWKNKSVKREEAFVQVCLHELMAFQTTKDIGRTLGWMARCSIPTILDFGARDELQPPYLVRACLSPGSLLLPLEYYLNPKIKETEPWLAYEGFINICSIELGLPFLHKAIEAERTLAPILYKSFQHLAQTKRGSSLESWVPDFEWSGFMEGLDIDANWKHRLWVINSSERVKGILKWICSSGEEAIISVLAIHILRVAAPYMRPSIREAHSKLFNRALRGVVGEPPEEHKMLTNIQNILPDALCSLYSRHHQNIKLLNNVKSFIDTLKQSAIEVMSETDVFSRRTKIKVKEKLHRMWVEVGKGKQSPMPQIIYNPDSFVHSLFSVNSARSKHIIGFTGKSAKSMNESYPCFITNASYFPESNHIVIPWGIIQEPFYSLNAPLGWNHGGLGATICHEITHGFDLEGSQYSPRGAYKEWWTRKNRSTFKRQTRKLSRFFSKFKHYGKKIDGSRTLSENWADLGGVKIALHALNKLLVGKSEEEKLEAHRNFFISYASSWRSQIQKKTAIFVMSTSVHSLSEDRVDRIVVHFEEWVQAFKIKKSDALFLEPSKRLRFF